MGKSTNRWWASMGRPPFEALDYVEPNGRYDYGGNHKWARGEIRQLLFVAYNDSGGYWELGVFNPTLNQISRYNPANFKVAGRTGETTVAYERTKFIGIKLAEGYEFIGDAIIEGESSTVAMDSQHQVRVAVAKRIEPGEKWLVVQTVALIEGEEPRPPVKVTEYK